MLVLVVNAGSSSLKAQLIQTDGKASLMKCLAEKVGTPQAFMNVSFAPDFEKVAVPVEGLSVPGCLRELLHVMVSNPGSPIETLDAIDAVGNRIVAGGEYFCEATLVDDDARAKLALCEELAPLHNPSADACIDLLRELLPKTPQVAVFDTAFHQTMPPKAFMYGVPMKYYTNLHVRRYGFHGTSHRYVSARAAEFLGKKAEDLRIITCHLGNGSSMCAVDHGKCVDTSMGITPLEGVIMGTRSGSLDPAVLQFIMNNAKDENGDPEIKNIDEMLEMLNKKSGLLGLSGISSDMRDIDAAADQGDRNASIARDMLIYGIRKYIGAYAAAMNGVDVIVFTAGIGENGIEMREKVMEGFEFLGAKIDVEKNRVKGEERDISAADSKVKVLVIPTNEEIVIARDTLHLVTGK